MAGGKLIPIIDLFAGPGGLGEGFSSLGVSEGKPAFQIRLSIEKDPVAHRTLELRSFFRQFAPDARPDEYYDHLRGRTSRSDLFAKHSNEAARASAEAWQLELSAKTASKARERITKALDGADPWVLIGGPPCQAYSLVGRSRNKHREDDQEFLDKRERRQNLYIEYLQVIADHGPAVFVMENVKGLLSAIRQNEGIFDRILEDLASPAMALKREGRPISAKNVYTYQLYSLSPRNTLFPTGASSPRDYVIRAERHGIPQARHRIIVVGVRQDCNTKPDALIETPSIPAWKVLDGLPRLRSGLSREEDSGQAWQSAVKAGLERRWLRGAVKVGGDAVQRLIMETIQTLTCPRAGRGAEFLASTPSIQHEVEWFLDPRIQGVCNHSTRGHMHSDLHRYLYAACFAEVHGRSPELRDFPPDLHPAHENIDDALNGSHFADRFRVQLRDRPSATVTSHIAKDGHYYIHYDPAQCRSLTVREAARLQTFPDNYFFCGGRTAQYSQVGNAVPPLLARQIADIVLRLLR